jgi:mannosyltransferase
MSRLHIRLTIVLIIALGLFLRLFTIEEGVFWIDEANTYHIAKVPLADIPEKLANDSSPPLYYCMLHLWMQWFGISEYALRSLSVVFSVLLLFAVFYISTACFSAQAGLWCAYIIAMSPLQIFYSQSARMYTLLPLLATLSVFQLVMFLNTSQVRHLVLYMLTTAMALLTHNFAFYILPVHLFLIIYSRKIHKWWIWLPAFGIIGFSYLPWLQTLIVQITACDTYVWFSDIWKKRSLFTSIYITLVSFSPGGKHMPYSGLEPLPYFKLPAAAYVCLAAAGMWTALKNRRGVPVPSGVWVVAFLTIPVLCALAVSYMLVPHFVSSRVDQMVFPAYALLVSLGVCSVRSKYARWLFALIIFIFGLYSTLHFHPDYKKAPFEGTQRDLARILSAEMMPDDILLCTSLSRASLEYYLDRLPRKPKIFSFPGSTAEHLGGQDDATLLGNREELSREAQHVLHQVRDAGNNASRLFVVLVKNRVNSVLEVALENDKKIRHIRRLGIFRQVGDFDNAEAHMYDMSGAYQTIPID